MTFRALWLALLLPAASASADEEATFITETAAQTGIDEAEIRSLLSQATRQERILTAISRPAEAKPWHEYRPIFLGEARIAAGRAFLREHAGQLAQVEAETGVPASLITAIIGVETNYGGNTGSFKVLDALYTLGFHYPPRQDFFRRELAQLFALGHAEGLDVSALKGSYAGAMGWGQFMPSSYLAYARDGDGDGRRDLFDSLPDVFASVANYFVAHGWRRGEPIVVPASRAADAEPFEVASLEPDFTVASLSGLGFTPADEALADDMPASAMTLDGAKGPEHWLTFQNFYAITRYNRSRLYALAVFQLAEAIGAGEGQIAP